MPRILLIEDNATFRGILALFLGRAGHTVIEAVNGRDGIRKLEAHGADLVITDIVMPEQEGLETIRILQALKPGLPIIAISGTSSRSSLYLRLARHLGAHRVLAKPFGADELLAVVRELL